MNHDALCDYVRNRFPGDVLASHSGLARPSVEIRSSALASVALFLRDDPQTRFDFLRCLTGVHDAEGFRVLYVLFSYCHRHALTLEVRLDAQAPEVASLCDVFATANWYEREAFDLLGIRFTNHPRLTRILLPEDWVGHPLRKDYVRPSEYHGIRTTREKPVTAVGGASCDSARTPQVAQHEVKTEAVSDFMRLNMGPHHPATHGVINFLLETDGEILRRATPDVGYLHRGIEKLAEQNAYIGTMPYTDRVDYLGAMFANHAWALAVERLAGISVPPRGEYCRVIASELNRIASHLIATGALAMDVGAFTPFIHWLREREKINDIMERVCGARLTYNYFRFGGVARDISPDTIAMIRVWLDHFEPMIDEFDRLISYNEIFVQRLANISAIPRETAIAFGLVGPNLRASGVDWDLRRDAPYSVYPELEFDVIVGTGARGALGDCYDRFNCRVREIRESVRILRQACAKLPEGEFWVKPKAVKPAQNEVYAIVEGARGELGAHVFSNGTDRPHRVHFRTGSFTAMSIIEHLSPGLMIADLVALIGALDVIAPEVDR